MVQLIDDQKGDIDSIVYDSQEESDKWPQSQLNEQSGEKGLIKGPGPLKLHGKVIEAWRSSSI